MKLSVIGCGYLGAVHAAAMASIGHEVVGIDVDQRKIDALSKGEAPFFEPGLPEILAEGVASGRLRFTTDMAEAKGAKVHFVGVGTPQQRDGYGADLTYVNAAIDGLVPYLSEGDIVAGKSTVPVGTAAELTPRVEAAGATLVWNPEFLREGWAVQDTIDPDRLVVGVPATDAGAAAVHVLKEVYAPPVEKGTPFIVTDLATAELVKVSANAFLATKISFINEMANLCEAYGANINRVREGMCSDKRIGHAFLYPGVGYGGSCFPKDTLACIMMGETSGTPTLVSKAVHDTNQAQRDRFFKKILAHFGGEQGLTGKTLAFWGLAFKPRTDDIRESPALTLARKALGYGCKVRGFDPVAMENVSKEAPTIELVEDMYECAQGADALVISTDWDEFKSPDFARLGEAMNGKAIFDGRNLYRRQHLGEMGWHYYSVGRAAVKPV